VNVDREVDGNPEVAVGADAAPDASVAAVQLREDLFRFVAVRDPAGTTALNTLQATEIILAELKRLAIVMLGGPPADQLVSVDPGDPVEGKQPTVDRESAAHATKSICFYEQAFEWPQISYTLYPYFWTGRDDWPEQSQQQAADLLFAAFLRAGAARVVLAVRPGFERAVCNRLAVALPEPWASGPALVPDEDPWLSLVEEIREAQDPSFGLVSVGDSWPVVLPTTLVALDDGVGLFDCPVEVASNGGAPVQP